jgi:hypothetical protein
MVSRSCSRKPIGAAAIPISCQHAVSIRSTHDYSSKDPLIILGTLQQSSWVISLEVDDAEPGLGPQQRDLTRTYLDPVGASNSATSPYRPASRHPDLQQRRGHRLTSYQLASS